MTKPEVFVRSPSRVMDDASPVLMAVVAKSAEGWGIAVLHEGEAVAFLTPKQARREARRFRELATLAERPGECPPFA